MLDHIAESTTLLTKIRRVLQPQGGGMIDTHGIHGQASDSDHKNLYDEEELSLYAKINGFKILKVFHIPLGRSCFLANIFANTAFIRFGSRSL
jgi:hypothetical protein